MANPDDCQMPVMMIDQIAYLRSITRAKWKSVKPSWWARNSKPLVGS